MRPVTDSRDRSHWLAAHVRERRTELELSQEQVASRAEMPLPTISQLERGGRMPSLEGMDRILAVLGEELRVGPRDRA
ncbi:MAG TPA: helix-turn-helix transcriptional regulator [Solirubrobacterales bacterium]|nr:helix-turn-helix transcriptional regulator [Solirubrobacterales bacterium]